MSLTDDAQLAQIETFVRNITPLARLEKIYGKEAQYVLPFDSSSSFPALFRSLDEQKETIKVRLWHLSENLDLI